MPVRIPLHLVCAVVNAMGNSRRTRLGVCRTLGHARVGLGLHGATDGALEGVGFELDSPLESLRGFGHGVYVYLYIYI